MGADIHVYVEVRNSPTSPWRSVDQWSPRISYGRWSADHRTYTQYTSQEYPKEEDLPKYEDVDYEDRVYTDRNYELFGLLSGVRTEPPLIPLVETSSIPPDCDPRIRRTIEEWGGDGHTHGYATLAEMQEFSSVVQRLSSNYTHLKRAYYRLMSAIEDRASSYQEDPDNIRVVFFYDN